MDFRNYNRTLAACNLAGFIQSTTMNLSPFIFVPLSEMYGISYTQLGFLVLVNFMAQFAADLYFGGPVNRYGYYPFCIGSQVAIFIGLVMFACAPLISPVNIFPVLVIATALFSAATGLLEVLLSPITKSVPAENSEANFMIMHTSFAGGIFAVALITNILLKILGNSMWQAVVLFWSIPPLFTAWLFMKAPMPVITPQHQRMKLRHLLFNRVFIISFMAIFFGAATELFIVQWGSSYLEKGLGLSKVTGDVGGLCLFAFMLGLGRYLYAKKGTNINLNNLMIYGSLACGVCYIAVAFVPYSWVVITAFGLVGIFSSMLWTGTLVVAADKLPYTGAVIFALLAGGGDCGTAVVGQVAGWLSDYFKHMAPSGVSPESYGLKITAAFAVAVPFLSLFFQVMLKKHAPHVRKNIS